LAKNELGEFEFIVAIVIWYEVLYAVNLISKHLQAKDMLIDAAIEKVQGLISFFEGYRETGFLEALEAAKGIAVELDIGTTFRKKRELKRKRQYDENRDDTNVSTQTPEIFLEPPISYLLLIKLLPHLQEDLNNTKNTKRILVSYLLPTHCSHWIVIA
jgi:hypothetical protein